MEKYQAFLYVTIFILSIPLVLKILMTIKIERLFPQGQILIIRVAYAISTIIISFLLSMAITYLVGQIVTLFQN